MRPRRADHPGDADPPQREREEESRAQRRASNVRRRLRRRPSRPCRPLRRTLPAGLRFRHRRRGEDRQDPGPRRRRQAQARGPARRQPLRQGLDRSGHGRHPRDRVEREPGRPLRRLREARPALQPQAASCHPLRVQRREERHPLPQPPVRRGGLSRRIGQGLYPVEDRCRLQGFQVLHRRVRGPRLKRTRRRPS